MSRDKNSSRSLQNKLSTYFISGTVFQIVLLFYRPIPVAERSKARICGRPLAGIAGLNPGGGHGCLCSCECCVLSGRRLYDGPIPLPEESYWLWCVTVCELQTSRMRRSWPALDCYVRTKNCFIGRMSAPDVSLNVQFFWLILSKRYIVLKVFVSNPGT